MRQRGFAPLGNDMILKIFAAAAAIAASTVATGAAAQSVTPEQVLQLPVGTKYGIPGRSDLRVIRTAKGFDYISGDLSVECNNVTKSGGRGNANINCTTASTKEEVRLEWIDMDNMIFELWENMAAKTGQKQHKPAQFKTIFKRM